MSLSKNKLLNIIKRQEIEYQKNKLEIKYLKEKLEKAERKPSGWENWKKIFLNSWYPITFFTIFFIKGTVFYFTKKHDWTIEDFWRFITKDTSPKKK